MKTLVLASGNAGKLREFNQLMGQVGLDVQAQSTFGVPEAIENGLTFVENAIIKARNACKHTGHAAMADDSGIEVDALQGAPGIYSARYSGQGASDEQNNNALLNALLDVPKNARGARYQCILVYMQHAEDPTPIICQESWEGSILKSPQGDGGFGYDPIFWVPTHQKCAAKLDKNEKNRISHRGKAMQAMLKALQAKLGN